MYISKKKTYKIVACAISAIFVGSFSGVASAEDDYSSNTGTTINENNYSGGDILPNHPIDSEDSHKTLNVSDITTNAFEINAGWSKAGTSYNILNIRNVNAPYAYFHGGYANYGVIGNDNAEWNIINFYSGTAGYIHGAHTYGGNANHNTVNFFNGETGFIGVGYSYSGNANYNTLNIYDGTINGKVYGGYTVSGDSIGNSININGGTFNGDIYSGTGNIVTDNVINIYGAPNLSNASIFAAQGGTSSNNSINIYTKDITAQDIGGFENLNFYLPANIMSGDTVLTINNPSGSISNNISVSSSGGSNLTTGDTVTLITTPSASGLNLGSYTSDGVLSQGISLDYELKLNPITSGGVTTGFVANVGNVIGGLKEQTTLLTSAVVDSASTLDSGTDRLLEWLPPEGIEDINSMPTTYFDPFLGIGGSSLKIDTGNGTKLKTKTGGINFGLASHLKNRFGTLIVAPVVDYGQDVYESTLNDENRTTGSGHTKYFTGGFIARQVTTHGMYYETSFRYGRVRTNFTSNNFLVHGTPTTASYSASTPCYSGHVRIGWRDHVSPQNILDVYGIYSLNKVKGFSTTVSTGEDYSFSAVNSGRMRLGARLTREVKEKQRFYSEIAYVHEFTGDTVGEYMGMNTKKAGLKGNTGLIELGWQMKPSANSATFLDAGITCWLGHQKGITFAAKFKRDF